MMQFTLSLLLMIFIIVGCDGSGFNEKVVTRPGEPDVVGFSSDDTAMNKAIAEAKRTLPEFIADLSRSNHTYRHRSLKVRFDTKEGPEHIWVTAVAETEQGFEGRLSNEPLHIPNLKIGDRVYLSKEQISDWLIVADGGAKGGYTIRAARNRMSPEERHAFDEQTGGAFRE